MQRLDRYLVLHGLARSRRHARALLEHGAVRLNGYPAAKATPVGADDRVELTAEASENARLVANPRLPVEVLFADATVVVVNKPGLMPCHPLRAGESQTVMNGVAAAFPETADAGPHPREGGLVHRLDNGTSGALIVARTGAAFASLRAALTTGQVGRVYHALACGAVERRLLLDTPIGHSRKSRRRMVGAASNAAARGAPRLAQTLVEPLRAIGPFTLLRVTPRTGRRHQIRVHLALAGHPLAGDALYGGPAVPGLPPGRFWLHLAELVFDSPASGPVRVEAPLPFELRAFL